MSAHAKYGPSSADRWMTCTASMALIDKLSREGKIPERESSEYAAEGTAAHQVREDALLLGMDVYDFIGQTIRADGMTFEVTEEMADYLQPGIDWVREMLDHIDVEIRVKLDPWMPGQFGTMDTGGIFGDTLLVDDLKYGAGVPVYAEGNKQMRLYGAGYWHYLGRPNVKRVLMVIDQPRAGGMKFWEISIEELREFAAEAAQVFLDIETGKTKFAPSVKACQWCPAKNTEEGCPAYNRWMHDVYVDAFSDDAMDLIGEPVFTDPDLITPERRWFIVQHADLAKKWLAKLHEDGLTAALDGRPDPGSKAVIGRMGNRFLKDERRAETVLFDALGTDAYTPLKLIGITDIEKKLKPNNRRAGNPEAWAAIEAILDQEDGKPILVPEDDPREAVLPIADQFEDL